MTATLYVTVPGELPPSPRPRARIVPALKWQTMNGAIRAARSMSDVMKLFRAQFYVPNSGGYREWKTAAAWEFDKARRAHFADHPFARSDAPLHVHILVVTALPQSAHRKRILVPRRWEVSKARGDVDNLTKGILDAGNGVLWHDDSQIASMVIEKVRAEQGDSPRVELMVRPLMPEECGVTRFESRRELARGAGRLLELPEGEVTCPTQRTDLPF